MCGAPVRQSASQSRAIHWPTCHLDTFTLSLLKTQLLEMELSNLAVPFVYALIAFLAYPSQWLMMYLEPGPLTKNELITTNVLVVLIFITYTKSVFVNPGVIPKNWAGEEEDGKQSGDGENVGKSKKWCRRCDAAKPPRAHHCKQCKRYSSGFFLLCI